MTDSRIDPSLESGLPVRNCPECGNPSHVLTAHYTADEFCRYCDYPLFWAPGTPAAVLPVATSEASRWRKPGEAGRVPEGSKECPACGELNDPNHTHCWRCRSELYPKPPVPAPPPPPRRVRVPAAPAPAPWWYLWRWWILAGGAALVAVAVTVVLLV